MKDQTIYDILRSEMAKWYKLNKQRRYNSQCLSILHELISKLSNTEISFDSRFADAIHDCINENFCTALVEQELEAIDLQIYMKMATQMYEKELISKRHLFDIRSMKPFNMVTKINEFLIRMQISRFNPAEIQQQWMEMFGVELRRFWQIVMEKRRQEKILTVLYGVVKKAPLIENWEELRTFIELIESGHKLSNQQLQVPKKISSIQQQIQIAFQDIAQSYALFKNPKFKQIVLNINKFIEYFRLNFKKKDNVLSTFGSLKSTFALIDEFDIDLTYFNPKSREPNKYAAEKHLLQVQQQIRNKQFRWYKQSKVYNFPKLPYVSQKCKDFGIQNVKKIDITMGNKTAIINSELLSKYANIPQIYYFCILVKHWAKNRNVINVVRPIQGVSSYVLILMCIFYLMETNQIEFLQIQEKEKQKFEVGSIVPSLRRTKIKSLFENFKGFLQFYSQKGKFHRQKKVVCLLKNKLPQNFFNQNYIINVYDFIDESNPGRLQIKDKIPHFIEFQRALMLLKSMKLHSINQIFDKK